MLRLLPGRFFEAGALGLMLDDHGHDEDSHYNVHGIATTVSKNGMRVVLVGFLVDGSCAQYFGEIQQANTGGNEPFDLVRKFFSEGAIEWPSGDRALSDMENSLRDIFSKQDFPPAPEQVIPF